MLHYRNTDVLSMSSIKRFHLWMNNVRQDSSYMQLPTYSRTFPLLDIETRHSMLSEIHIDVAATVEVKH
jgi:hypothetical protein